MIYDELIGDNLLSIKSVTKYKLKCLNIWFVLV